MKKILLLLVCCFTVGAGYACFQWYKANSENAAVIQENTLYSEDIFTQESPTPVQIAQGACQALLDGDYAFFTKAALPKPEGVDYAKNWAGLKVTGAHIESLNQNINTGRYALTMQVSEPGASPFPAGSSSYILETSVESGMKHPTIKTFLPEKKWVNQPNWTPSNVRYNSATQVQFFRTFGGILTFESTAELDKATMLELSIYFASREDSKAAEANFFDRPEDGTAPLKGITGYTKEQVDAASLSHFGLVGLTTAEGPCYDKATEKYHLITRPGQGFNSRLVYQKESPNGEAVCIFESYADPLQTIVESSITYHLSKNENKTWCLNSAVA